MRSITWAPAFLRQALTCIILFTTQGGVILPWDSGQLWFTLVFGLIALGGFIYEERHASEPIIPLHLFKERTFLLCCLIGFIIGTSLFGSDDLPAAVSASRKKFDAVGSRHAAAADDVRLDAHLDRERATDQQNRQISRLSDCRHAARVRGDGVACDAQ
jgi:hypothetical protein